MNSLIIVKLGGSLITHKDSPLKANMRTIAGVAAELAKTLQGRDSTRLILIHGGGSFGHYYASRYRISITPKQIHGLGTPKTAAAMLSLHSIVLSRLVAEGVPCKTVLASELLSERNEISANGKQYLRCLFRNHLVPITFGNVEISGRGSRVVSGDQITLALTKVFPVKKVIFAMDVDGIYQTSRLSGAILTELDRRSNVHGGLRKYDVTGGVSAKIETGMQAARHGADVYYVNGTKRNRIKSLVLGHAPVKSTHIAAMRISMR